MIQILLALAFLQNSLGKSENIHISSNSTSTFENKNGHLAEDVKIPSPSEVYDILIGMQTEYPEGKYWTDASSGTYLWKGGTGNNREIANMGTGCVYFCFHLSDKAFGTLPARIYYRGQFKISDIKTGDLLRVENNRHSVIVLRVYDQSVVIAEGNFNKAIHWGRVLTKSEVENANHLITRYPEGYISPEDPEATKEVASGIFGTNKQLHWSLNGAGYLTISGNGASEDFTATNRPWEEYIDQITMVTIEPGVTNIGSNSFYKSNVYGVTIADTVKTIGDSAFGYSKKLTMISIPEGTEILGDKSFCGCSALKTATIPSTIKELKDGAFAFDTALSTVKFYPGDQMVKMGNSIFTECYYIRDLTLPSLMDRISESMFYNTRLYCIYIPNGVQSIDDQAFNMGSVTTIVIPNTVTEFGFNIFTPGRYPSDIYFCGTQSQWNSIYKGANQNYMYNTKIHYVADTTSVKIVDKQGNDVQGSTVQMDVSESNSYTIQLTFSQGETLFDPRNVEWFCVVPGTPTNNIKAIESAVDAGDVVRLDLETTSANNVYSVTMKLTALKNGNARIIGHVKKNPTSSMATNTDHIYSYLDIKVQGPTTAPTSNPTSKPTTAPTSNPTTAPTSNPSSNPITGPTSKPTTAPSSNPTSKPTTGPTTKPSSNPTTVPTSNPTSNPISNPTSNPSSNPTNDHEIETQLTNTSSDEQDDGKNSGGKKKGLPVGAIAGIAVGAVAVLAGIVAVVVYVIIRRRRLYEQSTDGADLPNPNEANDAPQENASDPL